MISSDVIAARHSAIVRPVDAGSESISTNPSAITSQTFCSDSGSSGGGGADLCDKRTRKGGGSARGPARRPPPLHSRASRPAPRGARARRAGDGSPCQGPSDSLAIGCRVPGSDDRDARYREGRSAPDRVQLTRWMGKIVQLAWIVWRGASPALHLHVECCRRCLNRQHTSSGQAYSYIFRSDTLL